MTEPSRIIMPLTEDQQAVVHLLEESLKEARLGHINSIAIIVCMTTGYAHVMAGRQAADLNMGCDSLKRKILGAVEDDSNRKQPRRVLHPLRQ